MLRYEHSLQGNYDNNQKKLIYNDHLTDKYLDALIIIKIYL